MKTIDFGGVLISPKNLEQIFDELNRTGEICLKNVAIGTTSSLKFAAYLIELGKEMQNVDK